MWQVKQRVRPAKKIAVINQSLGTPPLPLLLEPEEEEELEDDLEPLLDDLELLLDELELLELELDEEEELEAAAS